MYFDSAYKDGFYPFPRHTIDPKDKNADWHRQMCEAMYSSYLNDRCGIKYSLQNHFITLRAYSDGKQDYRQYRKQFLDSFNNGAKNGEVDKGYVNINWQNICSPAPLFKYYVLGLFEDTDYTIQCEAIDEKSYDEKQRMMWGVWVKKQNKELAQKVKEFTGIGDEEEGFIPDSIGELKLWASLGGTKLGLEAAMEDFLNATFYLSNWKELKRKQIEDLFTLNVTAVKDYVDLHTQEVKGRYVNPSALICEASNFSDFHDSQYYGEVVPYTLTEMISLGMSEDQARSLAVIFNGIYDNAPIDNFDRKNIDGSYSWLDTVRVPVLDAEFASVDIDYTTSRKTKYGETLSYPDEFGKIWDTDKRKSKKTDVKVWRRAKWVVGTEFIFDWGLQYDIPRPTKREALASYHVMMLPGMSRVEAMIPQLDFIQNNWLRLQNFAAKARPSGVSIEITSLENMTLGGKKAEPMEMLRLSLQTGDYLYKATTHRGYVNIPGGYRPIQPVEGGIGRNLEECIKLFEFNMQMIREIVGISAPAVSGNPQDMGLGVSQIAIAATSNALKPLFYGYVTLKKNMALNCAIRCGLIAKYNYADEIYGRLIGKKAWNILKQSANEDFREWGIQIVAKPTDAMKNQVLATADMALKSGQINMGDWISILRFMDSDKNLKYIQAFLSNRANEEDNKKIQLQRENMGLDMQSHAQQVQEKSAAKTQEIGAKTQSGMALEDNKAKNKAQLMQIQAQIDALTKQKEELMSI